MSNKTERKREEGWGKGVFGERFGENERWGKRVREIDRVGEKWRMERERCSGRDWRRDAERV